MQCLQLPFIIRVEEAVSWTQRFLQETFCPKNEVFYDKQNWKKMFGEILRFK